MNIQLLFGRNLKRLRTSVNLSQMDLADVTALAQNFINDIEHGRKWVSAKTIAKFMKALKVKPFQFFIDPSELDGQEKDTIKFFMADFVDNMTKMVKKYQRSYLADGSKDEKK